MSDCDKLRIGTEFKLVHMNTGARLHSHGNKLRDSHGHHEVTCYGGSDSNDFFKLIMRKETRSKENADAVHNIKERKEKIVKILMDKFHSCIAKIDRARLQNEIQLLMLLLDNHEEWLATNQRPPVISENLDKLRLSEVRI